MSFEKFGLILYFNFLQKYLCSKKYKIKLFLNLCFSLHKYFCKKLEYKIKPIFSKDRIKPPLVVFSAFLKKITTTKSTANFLSPDSNGQGSYVKKFLYLFVLPFAVMF